MNSKTIEKMKYLKDDNISINEKNKLNIQNYFESSINISEIENKENEKTKKNNINEENDIENSFNTYINLDEESVHQQNKEINININKNKIKKKLTKEDLDNIPLPIFSCIYCSNDFISFKHLSNELLYIKYYYQTSVYNIKMLNKLINTKYLVDQYNNNFKLLDMVIKHIDYLKKYYLKENSFEFYNSEKYKILCISNNLKIKNFFLQKIIIRKKNKDLTNKKINSNKHINKNISYNKLSFHNNNSNSIGNDNFYNVLGNIKNNNNTIGAGTCQGTGSYSSLNNILNNNEINNNNNNLYFNNLYFNNFNNMNIMENIMEKIEKNEESENDDEGGDEFLNIFGNESQVQKKVNKNKIIFEDKYYDIWNPNITEIDENENENAEIEIKINETNKENNFIHLNEKTNKKEKNNFKNNKNNLTDELNNNKNNKINDDKNNLSDELKKNKNKININEIEKIDNSTQKIFSERKLNEIKQIFNYSQTSNIQKNKNNNLTKNKIKKLYKINIIKSREKITNFNFNKNEDNSNKNKDNHLSYDYFKNNIFKFKPFYMNKNKRNLNNNSNKNLFNLINTKNNNNLDNNEFLCHTKDLNKESTKDKEKDNKKDEKIKNMTINTSNHDLKNLLFLLKYPKSTSNSNKMSPKMININAINAISPKIIRKPFSSYKNIKNENYIIVNSKKKNNNNTRNSTEKIKKFIDKTKFKNNLSDYYESNIQIHNSSNDLGKKNILNNNKNYGNLIKSNSALMNGNGSLKDKNGFSYSSVFNMNYSKLLYKNKSNEKLNELVKNFSKKNYKINVNDFVFPNKKINPINNRKNNAQKIKYNFHSPPILSKRSESVCKAPLQKKSMFKLKI